MYVDTNALNNLALIYDPRGHTFESWASLMCEAFASQQMEIPIHTTTWQGWAVGMVSVGLFNNEAIPDPYQFDTWDSWATAAVGAFNPKT